MQPEFIDTATGELLAAGDEALIPLFTKLSASFREGQLFLEKKMLNDEPLIEAFQNVPEGITKYFVKRDDKLYLRRAYDSEKACDMHYQRIKKGREQLSGIDRQKIEACTRLAEAEKMLLPEQAEAIIHASKEPLSCIFGGPGTGKTYTAGLFIKFFVLSFLEKHLRIALVGPTGKATQNLQKSIERALGDDFAQLKPHIEAKTLHALLLQHKASQALPYHLIVVDESSMIDAALMASFLSKVQEDTKVLFLGDPYQLPPIEPGDVFASFYAKEQKAKLEKCMRTDLQNIVQLASFVKEGLVDEVFELLVRGDQGIRFKEIAEDAMADYLTEKQKELIEELEFGSLRLLSPKKDGPWGVDTVNAYLYSCVKHKKEPLPIIISKNDYELQLMNGEMGYLNGKTAFFDNGKLEIPSILLTQYELAFCLSVHKSQGSEFDKVILLLPPGSEAFGKRMLYTAITRARKAIEIWSTKEIMGKTITS